MASRAQLVEEVILPVAGGGPRGVSDRFLLSNSFTRDLPAASQVEEIGAIGQAATSGLLPDLTLVLDVPPAVARARIGPARDRIEDRPEAYQVAGPRRIPRGRPRGVRPGKGLPVLPRPARGDRRDGRSRRRVRPDPEARWSVSWHSVRGHDRIVESLRVEPAERAVPPRLPVRRPRGRRQADVRPDAGPGPALRAKPRDDAGAVRALSRLRPGRGRNASRPARGRPARGPAGAADPGHPRPLRRVRPQAGPGHAEGRHRRRRRRHERRGGQRVPQDAGRAAPGCGPDPDRHLGRAPARDDRLAVPGDPFRSACPSPSWPSCCWKRASPGSGTTPPGWRPWAKAA